MQIKFKMSLIFVCGLFLSSCASWQAVKVAPGLNVNNEIIMKPELQNLISKRQNIKIVLRVPGAPKNITQEAQKEVGRPYDRLERELSKVGFVVRDRELLEKVVSELKPATYMELAKAIDTDLILEVLYVGPCDLSHKQYYDAKAGHMAELVNPSVEIKHPGSLVFPMHGGEIDCRVVTMRDGTVSGMFTIYNMPCDGSCDFEVLKGREWRNPEPNPEGNKGWGVGNDDQNIRQLATLLMQTLSEGEIVVSKLQAGSPAVRHGFMVNDVIKKINNQPIYNLSQTTDMIAKIDGKIDMLIKRDDKEIPVSFVKKFAEPMGMQLTFKPRPPEPPAPVEEKLPLPPPPPPPPPVVAPVAPPAPVIQKEEAKPVTPPAPVKAVKKAKKPIKAE